MGECHYEGHSDQYHNGGNDQHIGDWSMASLVKARAKKKDN